MNWVTNINELGGRLKQMARLLLHTTYICMIILVVEGITKDYHFYRCRDEKNYKSLNFNMWKRLWGKEGCVASTIKLLHIDMNMAAYAQGSPQAKGTCTCMLKACNSFNVTLWFIHNISFSWVAQKKKKYYDISCL